MDRRIPKKIDSKSVADFEYSTVKVELSICQENEWTDVFQKKLIQNPSLTWSLKV